MVVDDNEDHCMLMSEVLDALGFSVLTARSGAECLILSSAAKLDLFLIDISMPVMNGWQLATRLRASGQSAPILMVSANIGDGTLAAEKSGNHSDTIAKPVDLLELNEKIALHLGLEWIEKAEMGDSNTVKTRMANPGAAHLVELINLAEIGYVRGIEAKLAILAAQPESADFSEIMLGHL